ncbi:xyloglucan galactosyltransferase MUR3-like [Rutidosis leptorrhynchoides]|uniref:xyloglucan galactosyltransferase MUR3-like n=1 Tax=Rutidosis leptorrhynchoides TaxID=125765 RepID=UPI003A997FA9
MFKQSHVCVLVLLCAFLWLCLLYSYGVSEGHIFWTNISKTDQNLVQYVPEEENSESVISSNRKDFGFMKAMRSAKNTGDPCGGRYIFVYDLPSRFNEDIVKECASINKWLGMCKFTSNGGFGPKLNNTQGVFSNNGWYNTDHFTLDLIFFNRMKKYECLTNDSSLASAIFVPFYAGFDVARYLWGYNVSMRDATSFELVDWLQKRDEWKIMNGQDHFLVGGRPTWDYRRSSDEETDWGNKFLLLPAVKNMSTLLVESNPWNSNDFAIPYPTYFHPCKAYEVFDWQDRMIKLERKWLFSFAGAPRPNDRTSIRSLLIDQCKNSRVGKLLDCGIVEKKCQSPSNVMKMFQNSVFCLQPQGDSSTRRSAFDSILAGCIPVFFHPGSFYTQYIWYLPKNYTKYSVFISEDDIRKNVSIEQCLSQISPQNIKKMRENVISLIPKVIYANPRCKLETLKDAFDVSVEAIINKVTKLRKDMIEGRTDDDDLIEGLSWKYGLLGEDEYVNVHEWDLFFDGTKNTPDTIKNFSIDDEQQEE